MEQEAKKITKRAIPGYTITPRDGYCQLRKIGLTAERVRTDPRFGSTRQQAKDFAAMLRLAGDIRRVLSKETGKIKWGRKFPGVLMKVLQADTTHPPGSRTLVRGGWQWLQGLDLNQDAKWDSMIKADFTSSYDSRQQEVIAQIPALIPAGQLKPPAGVTHYRLKATVITMQDINSIGLAPWQQSTLIPIKELTVPAMTKRFKVESGGERVYLLIMFAQWYKPLTGKAQLAWYRVAGPLHIMGVYGYP